MTRPCPVPQEILVRKDEPEGGLTLSGPEPTPGKDQAGKTSQEEPDRKADPHQSVPPPPPGQTPPYSPPSAI